tara:strand:+ start:3089 stop:3451 length:363 start_codon:yes stop_codon:yes gene_type:complete
MTIARNLSETTPFKIDSTTYTMATMPNRVLLAVTEMGQAAQTETLVRFGVSGWSGLTLKGSVAVPCVRDVIDLNGLRGMGIVDETFDVIPVTHMAALAGEAFRVNSLTEEEVGNSSAPLE